MSDGTILGETDGINVGTADGTLVTGSVVGVSENDGVELGTKVGVSWCDKSRSTTAPECSPEAHQGH